MFRTSLLAVGLAAALTLALVFTLRPLAQGFAPARVAAATPAAVSGEPRSVSVTGLGQVAITPDLATVTFGVESSGTDLVAAQNDNAKRTQATIDKLKALGVEVKDLQTTGYNVQPQYDKEQKPTGYKVVNMVRATVRDLPKLGAMIDGAVAAGANRVSGISFDVANKTDAMSRARQAAVADAHQKAQQYAQLTNSTLGAPLKISESVNTPEYRTTNAAPAGAAPAVTTPIETGQGSISITVQLVYELQ